MPRMERPPLKRPREDRKGIDIRRNQAALLRKKLVKRAITATVRHRNVPPIRKLRQPPTGEMGSNPVPAVRKTKTATEAASGAQRGWRKLYVGDLYDNITSGDVKREFEKFGKIFDIWVARNPPGFAFVDFMESRDAARALRVMDGNHKLGKKIKVEFAKKIGPRTASFMSLVKKGVSRSRIPMSRDGRLRRLSGQGSYPPAAYNRRSPQRRGLSPPQWHRQFSGNRSPPIIARRRKSPLRYDHRGRRSPSPLLRRSSYPPPPLPPPMHALFDPYDPQFREMALMGGWSRGRSPVMAPPPPLPPRYRSRSPSPPPPRYRGRSPPPRRSPGRFGSRDRNRLRGREEMKYPAAASLVYPPLSHPPPSILEMEPSPPRRLRSPPPRRRTPPPRVPAYPRSPLRMPRDHSPVIRGRASPPPSRLRHRSPIKPRSPPPPRHRSPPRAYSPLPPRVKSPPPPRRRSNSPDNYGRISPPPPPQHWAGSPPRRGGPPPPMMRQRGAPMHHNRSRSRSPVRMRSPPRPRSPPPERHSPRSWSPVQHRGARTPPRSYSPPMGKPMKSPDRPRSRVSNHKNSPNQSWGRSGPPLPVMQNSPPIHERNSLPRPRTPPRGYTPPPHRDRSPPPQPRYKASNSIRVRSPPPQPRQSQSYSSRSGRR